MAVEHRCPILTRSQSEACVVERILLTPIDDREPNICIKG